MKRDARSPGLRGRAIVTPSHPVNDCIYEAVARPAARFGNRVMTFPANSGGTAPL